VPVLKNDSADALATRVLEFEHQIYPLAAEWFCQGRIELRDGDVLFDNQLLPVEGVNIEIHEKT
jgi:phosphoribosylglycinamide formyltransferase-1